MKKNVDSLHLGKSIKKKSVPLLSYIYLSSSHFMSMDIELRHKPEFKEGMKVLI